ncbi:hypothetical protein EDB81DRAFT_887806 [Dactylonectria macrodidyma]|uniref:Uncharacterized protein n=1 Tax=Dactylonectria macrodidyma TaxID=307937 RepID=A0A9P9IVX1_9HYPO|nr:hypothetical protein EDB81DRAFT_887806 [Dactylonectria macrodidyma]
MKSVPGDGSASSNVPGGDQRDPDVTAHQPHYHGAHATLIERRMTSYEVDDSQHMSENEDAFNPINHAVESPPNLDFWIQGPASSPGFHVSSTTPFLWTSTDPSESFSASLSSAPPPPPPPPPPPASAHIRKFNRTKKKCWNGSRRRALLNCTQMIRRKRAAR